MTSRDYERFCELSDRDAIGEALTEEEQVFLRGFAESDAAASAETRFWDSLAGFDAVSDEVGSRRLADIAVSRVKAEPARTRRMRMTTGVVAALVAAAAATVVFVAGRAPEPAPSARAEEIVGVVELAQGEVRAAGVPSKAGAPVAKGSEIEAVGGPVCLRIDRSIHACLASGAKLRVASIAPASRRVDLVAGRVSVALSPLPSGERFSVVAGETWSTAVGTAFSVEIRAGLVETVVHEGKVAVGPEFGGTVVPAHKIGLVKAGALSVDGYEQRREATSDWLALGSVAGRSIEEPWPTAEAAHEPSPGAAAVPTARFPSTESGRGAKALAPAQPERAASVSAPELIGQARQALRDSRWADAASAYERIVTGFPGSPEATTVLVPLAGLEIDRLGRPASALARLDAYLASGGPLSLEAKLAKIRAYRALGRTEDEAATIDGFLAAHPNALDAPRLRERRDALRSR